MTRKNNSVPHYSSRHMKTMLRNLNRFINETKDNKWTTSRVNSLISQLVETGNSDIVERFPTLARMAGKNFLFCPYYALNSIEAMRSAIREYDTTISNADYFAKKAGVDSSLWSEDYKFYINEEYEMNYGVEDEYYDSYSRVFRNLTEDEIREQAMEYIVRLIRNKHIS